MGDVQVFCSNGHVRYDMEMFRVSEEGRLLGEMWSAVNVVRHRFRVFRGLGKWV